MYTCPSCGNRDFSIGASVCPNCDKPYPRSADSQGKPTVPTGKQTLVERQRKAQSETISTVIFEVKYHDGGRDLVTMFVEASSTKQARRRLLSYCEQETCEILDLNGNSIRFAVEPDRQDRLNHSVIARKYSDPRPVETYITPSPLDSSRMTLVSVA